MGLWGVGGCVWGGTGWGCIFLFGVWGVGFTGALGVGCYLCVMSAWGLGGCGKRVLGEVGHSGVVWGFGGVVCVRGG